jgi:selenocysteine lyase/cysteine desulfurase
VKKQHPVALQSRLYSDHGVELPVYDWEDTTLARVSIGPYTDESDLERLVDAIRSSV